MEKVLEPPKIDYMVGLEVLLMDGNVQPHRTHMMSEYLQIEDITQMDWSSYSSDLNLVEHVWDAFRQCSSTFL
ncbi:hypothetical protein TNCV_1147701 [Trichonephila clavipes]|nr:hypothetical protein TNCV_1147701 [Trichonephila clavipes]